MNQLLDLELRVAAALHCTYDLDDPPVAAVVDKSPDRSHPAEGGAVVEFAIRLDEVCVEDDKLDLLTGCHEANRARFLAALRDLVVDYEERTHHYSQKIEVIESIKAGERDAPHDE